MPIDTSVAADIVDATLKYYIRGDVFKQTMQDKPLLRVMDASKETFPGGNLKLSYPIQGKFMNEVAGFFAGYTEDSALTFQQAMNIDRAEYQWKEVHAGLIITWTELKKDGITVRDSQRTSEHTRTELIRLTGLLKNRLDDFGESWSRAFNKALWAQGGLQTSLDINGVLSILDDTPTVGPPWFNVGGIETDLNPWWNNRAATATANESTQALSKMLRAETRQLRRYGGRPNVALCGAGFLEKLDLEVAAKGNYTQEGWVRSKNDIGISQISLLGLGRFEYDPTLDDPSWATPMTNWCFVMDTRHIKLHPMEGEDNKILNPERPYDYLVFLRSMTWTGLMGANQLNCHGIYKAA